MDWLLYFSLAGLLVTGLMLNVVGLPGLWLMVAAHGLFAWLDVDDSLAGWPSTLAMVALACMAELVEFLAGAAGSKKAGGSVRSTVGAVVGGVAGGILGAILVPMLPIVNAILGACVGSFAGAALLEASVAKQDIERRGEFYGRVGNVGWGAFKGRFWGILLKTVIGLVMLAFSLWTAWG